MTERKSFPGIAPACWEHPADKAALAAFASVPGASDLVRRLVGSTAERSFRLAALASAARVSADQFPGVHRLVAEACRVLDLSPLPEVFVRRGVEPDAFTVGVERPFIVLSSAALDFWDEAELLAVIGHEVGHILSGHAVYKTLLEMLLKAAGFLGGGPLAGVAFAAAK
ncbi:MAG: M48 family metallopeptidase, partial [Spirochaetaceae bacterium]|nr:M48 family metallopeptidase [Spirochaetaceae bacterium]